MNYDDFISEQKFIHAVSLTYVWYVLICILYMQQYKIGPNDDIKAKKVGQSKIAMCIYHVTTCCYICRARKAKREERKERAKRCV